MLAVLLARYPVVSETFVLQEIEGLRAAGRRVEVFTLERTREPQGGLLTGAVRRVPTAHQALLVDPLPEDLRAAWPGRPKDLRRAAWLARALRRCGASALHVHFLGPTAALGAVACAVAGLPLVITVHARGVYVPEPMGLWALPRASALVAISRHAAEAARALGGPPARVLPLGVAPAPPAPPGPAGRLTVLTVARPAPKKGLPVLRAALEGLDLPWRWRVVGATAEALGGPHPQIEAMGPQPLSRVEKMYQEGVDLFALACQRAPDGDMDGVPVALMEAMARGVPALSCPVGAVGELIEHGRTGWLAPPGDAAALRAALRQLALDAPLRRRLGEAGREATRARCPEVRTRALGELLDGLTAPPRPG